MRFDIVTLFPDFFRGPFDYGVTARALRSGLAEAHTHDLRTFTHDRHRTVDDRPFGGGEGMVLKPQPLFECLESLAITPKPQRDTSRESVVLLSAQGRPFTQPIARELASLDRLVLLCGRYEGVDERVNQLLCDRELSIGDYVLSGGELAAAVLVDAVTRLLPGVLGHEDSSRYESFGEGDEIFAEQPDAEPSAQPSKREPSAQPSKREPFAQPSKREPSAQPSKREPSAQPSKREPFAQPSEREPSAQPSGKDCHPERSLAASSRGEVEGPRESSRRKDRRTLSAATTPQKRVPRSTHASGGLLDYPHYTRPAEFHGLTVPEVLLNGDHTAIRRWRRQAALAKTFANRPDLLVTATLSDEDREFLSSLRPR